MEKVQRAKGSFDNPMGVNPHLVRALLDQIELAALTIKTTLIEAGNGAGSDQNLTELIDERIKEQLKEILDD